jgi:adenylate cyclase
MGFEIERKFLVRSADWRGLSAAGERISQGYLARTDNGNAEVRVRCYPSRAVITIKGAGELMRSEFEYQIPCDDAHKMLGESCRSSMIEKIRHAVQHAGVTWYVDEFLGKHAGLVLAEVELETADQTVGLPSWIGKEVTADSTYRNSNLAADPRTWRTKTEAG